MEQIKLNKEVMKYEWYQNNSAKSIFLLLLFLAKEEDGKENGIDVRRGQTATTLSYMSIATGMTTSQVRTAMSRLQKSGNINVETSNRYSLVTINDFDKYAYERLD